MIDHVDDVLRGTVERVLASVDAVFGTRVAFVSCIDGDDFTIVDAVDDGEMGFERDLTLQLSDTFCVRALAGRAPAVTRDAVADPVYHDAPARTRFGIHTYAMAPIVLDDGTVFGTLCVLDRGDVEITEDQHQVLRTLAELIARAYDERLHKAQLRDVLLRYNRESERRVQLVEDLADDLDQPANHIRGLAQLVADQELDPTVATSSLDLIAAHAYRIEVLLKALRSAEGAREFTPQRHDVTTILEEIAETAGVITAQEVTVSIDTDVDGVVETDQRALVDLLTAIVLAAAERTSTGSLRLSAAVEEGQGAVFEVLDHGWVLSSEEQASVIGDATATAILPIPLSLSLARRLARRLGARLEVEEQASGGTCIRVRLPAGPPG